jgi:L-amino acid N-acyltransferase YncA
MAGGVTFELFQTSDAEAVARLLNRNHFYLGEYAPVSAEEFLFVQKCRGMLFAVLAKKDSEVIGITAAYLVAGQKVAKPYQVIVGTMLLDIKHRLSFTILVGLYETLLKELARYDCLELLSETSPTNTHSVHLLTKYGFVLLDDKPDLFGFLTFHNYTPTLSKFLGINRGEAKADEVLGAMPVAPRQIRPTARQLVHDRYIACDYLMAGKKVTVLIDVVDLKVEGIRSDGDYEIAPVFDAMPSYVIRNLHANRPLEVRTRQLASADAAGTEGTWDTILLEPKEEREQKPLPGTELLEFVIGDTSFSLFPHHTVKRATPRISTFEYETFSLRVDHNSGFVSLTSPENEELLTFMWPCVQPPYLEGILAPRDKVLTIREEQGQIHIEETEDGYRLRRSFTAGPNGITVETSLACDEELSGAQPLSQIWTGSGLRSCLLRSADKELLMDPSSLDPKRINTRHYPYWDPPLGPESGFPVQSLSLGFDQGSAEVTIDKRCKPVVHIPILTFFLDFDSQGTSGEQTIETVEIIWDRKDAQ